jgi:hypothetical protein
MGVDNPTSLTVTTGVDGHHHALRSKAFCGGIDEIRVIEGSRIHAYLVGPGKKHGPDIGNLADAPANSQRHETGIGRFLHDLPHGGTALMGGSDIEENKFIGSLGIIGPRTFNRVASVTDILELGAFHNTSSVDVKARDDSFAKHGIVYDTCRAPVIKSEKVIG